MKYKLTLIGMILLLASCTTVRYQSPELAHEAKLHREVAVLPFEVVLTGNPPADLTPERIATIEQWESQAFQAAMYDSLLNRSGADKKSRIDIKLQTVEETNRILRESGLAVVDTWSMQPEELARLLEVDAVLRVQVQKTRYLSDPASFGIDVAVHVANEATDGRYWGLLPHGLIRTHDIWADASLINAEDGRLLWRIALERGADWSRPANDVIVGVTRKLAKKFPYQEG